MFSVRNILFVLFVMVVAAVGGFFAGRMSITNNVNYIAPSPVFKTVNATIEGKITSSNSSDVTVTTTDNQTAVFPIQSQVAVSKRDPNSTNLATLKGSQAIELNQNAFITLVWENKQFVVTHIVYP